MTTYTRSKSFQRFKYNQGTILSSILIIVSMLFLGFFYILQANSVVSQGYAIRELNNSINELQVENQKLQIKTARLQFPSNLEEIAQRLNMVEVDNMVYLKDSAGVALTPQVK